MSPLKPTCEKTFEAIMNLSKPVRMMLYAIRKPFVKTWEEVQEFCRYIELENAVSMKGPHSILARTGENPFSSTTLLLPFIENAFTKEVRKVAFTRIFIMSWEQSAQFSTQDCDS